MKKFAAALAVPITALALAAPATAEPVVICSPGAGVSTTNTSCPFATYIHDNYHGSGGYWSPVTKTVIGMTCVGGYDLQANSWPWNIVDGVRCSGGNNAVVYVW